MLFTHRRASCFALPPVANFDIFVPISFTAAPPVPARFARRSHLRQLAHYSTIHQTAVICSLRSLLTDIPPEREGISSCPRNGEALSPSETCWAQRNGRFVAQLNDRGIANARPQKQLQMYVQVQPFHKRMFLVKPRIVAAKSEKSPQNGDEGSEK